MEQKLEYIINKAFDVLEENNAIRYTKKYNREYLISGFSQINKPIYEYFGFSTNKSLPTLMARIITNNLDKPRSRPWFHHLIYITGHKWCNTCKTPKLLENFNKDVYNFDDIASNCIDCHKIKNNTSYKNNKGYYKNKAANRHTIKLQRKPNWIGENEELEIKVFINNCPEGYHVDHEIPLQGENVSGLHVPENLQYLSAKDNLSKGNKFDIIQFNNL